MYTELFRKKIHPVRSAILCAVFFLLVLVIVLLCLGQISSDAAERQKESLENALWRSITQYYATEGQYPETLEALTDEYGITYDTDTFFVDYQTQGANILPDVTVITR